MRGYVGEKKKDVEGRHLFFFIFGRAGGYPCLAHSPTRYW
jgi:hypothetical protein